ncbi:MAG: hypothetical protein WBG47_09130 [Gordonia sp. (in: high G+C Gram-positive bacteria)]|uniref:hypothetical protein n=1 Tax=Gordonia sp. (in: high G+C Gram-positive bacteria) TaxID=84139 RepID=UPI003C78C1F6
MRGSGCWSAIVAAPHERVALRLTPTHEWLVGCDLPAGHVGPHGSDGEQMHSGRRKWLLWGDYARGSQNLSDEFECPSRALDGAPCLFFAGHGGQHRYAAPVGRDFPEPLAQVPPAPAPSQPLPRQAPARPQPPVSQPPAPQPPAPRAPAPQPPEWARRAGYTEPIAPAPAAAARSASALDELFAGMPSLKDLPHTDILAFPEESFRQPAPAWPTARGTYVAEHHVAQPVVAEPVVSGPDRFYPAETIIDVEPVEIDGAGARSRHRIPEPPRAAEPEARSEMLQIRQATSTVLTTPLVEVVSSGLDPVRMGVPTARHSLPRDADIASIAAVVQEVAAQMRTDPQYGARREVSLALHDVAASLGRLADALKPR